MPQISRKSTPKVTNGNVRKKNNWQQSPDYYYAPNPRMVEIDRRRPRPGFRHILTKNDIYKFLELLPDWKTLAIGLNGIALWSGSHEWDGLHSPGVVYISAWDSDLWVDWHTNYFEEHKDIFARLGVESEPTEDGYIRCKWTEPQIRAYQLLHILLHELGHHHDRMTTRKQRNSARGETFAEEYARRYEARIWQDYLKVFDL